MRSYLGGIDIYISLLASSFKLQIDTSVLVRVVYAERGAVPAGSLIVVNVGIHRIFRIETMGQGDLLPQWYGFRLPFPTDGAHHFPNASHILPDEFPMLRKALLAVGGDEGVCL